MRNKVDGEELTRVICDCKPKPLGWRQTGPCHNETCPQYDKETCPQYDKETEYARLSDAKSKGHKRTVSGGCAGSKKAYRL